MKINSISSNSTSFGCNKCEEVKKLIIEAGVDSPEKADTYIKGCLEGIKNHEDGAGTLLGLFKSYSPEEVKRIANKINEIFKTKQ